MRGQDNKRQSFNPSKFANMLDEGIYTTGPKGESLKSERVKLVEWLRKKARRAKPAWTWPTSWTDVVVGVVVNRQRARNVRPRPKG